MAVTQTVEFQAPTGLTLTVKLFDVGGDTALATVSATEKTTAKLTYTAAFTDIPTDDYMIVAFTDVGTPVASYYVTLELETGTYRPWDATDPTPGTGLDSPISYPTTVGSPTVTECDTLPTVSPDDSSHNGCPVLGKTRHVSISEGQTATVSWPLRDRKGNTISLGACVTSSSSSLSGDDSKILVRIADAICPSTIYQVVGSVSDFSDGIVTFEIPDGVAEVAGIYQMEIGVIDANGKMISSEKGYISVERGLFGDITNLTGPPTIEEIRLQLRDTLLENDLIGDVEFQDVEIINSILRPIREWNETPPEVSDLNASNFPWHYNWVNAVIGNLLFTAAHWYERNNLPSQHGGVTVNDRAKANPYLAIAQQLRGEWKEFVIRKKIEINIDLGMTDFGSDYD